MQASVFLGMQGSDDKQVQAAMEKIVDEVVNLMRKNELGHMWAAWHPHRFAAVSAHAYLFLDDPARIASRWNSMVRPKDF